LEITVRDAKPTVAYTGGVGSGHARRAKATRRPAGDR
jgi:hypothetical protein